MATAPRSGSAAASSPMPGSRPSRAPQPSARPAEPRPFEPPISALGPLFRNRLERIYACRVAFVIDINTRPTTRVLGGYYKSRRLVRDLLARPQGRPAAAGELFDTFLHEVAHHLEYTEPQSFDSQGLPARPRPDAQPAVLADPRRAETDVGRGAGAALGRDSGPSTAVDPRSSRLPDDPIRLRPTSLRVPEPSSLTLAATSSPALSVLTFLSISLMIPSLSM